MTAFPFTINIVDVCPAPLTSTVYPAPGAVVLPPVMLRGALGAAGFRPYSGATTAQTVSWGAALPQGVLRPADYVTLSGAPIQFDPIATYPDGSVRLAGFAAQVPAMAAGQWCNGALDKHVTITGPNVRPVAITGTVSLAGQTLDLCTVPPGPITRQGPLMVEWTARVPMPGVSADFEISLDVRQYADGTPPLIDVGFARTRVTVTTTKVTTQPPAAPDIAYTAVMTGVGGVNASVTIPQHGLARIWHWTANECPVHVIGDTTTLRAAGAMILDDCCGVPNNVLASLSTAPTTPLGHGDITMYFPTTGDRADLATAPEDQARWMISQDPRAALNALNVDAAAWSGVPWHYRNIATDRWVSPMDTPTIWLSGTGYLSVNTLSSGDGWTADAAHAANFAWVPWIMTLRQKYGRDLAAQANASAMYLNPPARLNDQAMIVSTPSKPYAVQTRGQAWAVRTYFVAAAFLADSDPFAAYFKQVVANNLAGQRAWISYATTPGAGYQGEIGPWIPGATDVIAWNIWAPWCSDYMVTSLVLGDRLGFACGDVAQAFARPLLAMASQNGCWPSNYPAVFQCPGYDEKGGLVTTWDKAAQILNAGAITSTVSINNVSAGDTLTINATMITFVAAGATGNQVNIVAGAPATTARNAAALLNASGDPGLSSATYSTANNALYVTPKNPVSPPSISSSNAQRLTVGAPPIHAYPASPMTAATLQGGTAMSAERCGTAQLMMTYPAMAPTAQSVLNKYATAALTAADIANGVTNAGAAANQELRWRVK